MTNPPVSNVCLHAISSLLEKDTTKRIGATGFHTFTDNPFFREIDFEALEKKQIPPIFVPSSEKTNFDATYDLEELLLEEAPLEARARRQKPRAQLKEDATDKEKRDDELHKMIETLFEPFDYTLTATDPTTLPATEAPEGATTDSQDSEGMSAAATPGGSPELKGSAPISRTNTQTTVTGPRGPSQSTSRPRTNTRSTSRSTIADLRPGRPGEVPPMPGTPEYKAIVAEKNATMPADAVKGAPAKSSGMLGFLKGKGGRARSPKPREPGVLGKEGARVIVNEHKSRDGKSKSR